MFEKYFTMQSSCRILDGMKRVTAIIPLMLLAACGPFGQNLSPIIGAAREGDTARITELAKAGADVNVRGGVNSWTPLLHAIHKNQIGSVRALLDAGADVNASGGGGVTPLVMAAGYGYTDIVRLLLSRGAPSSAGALSAAVTGTSDIDRFTVGQCQTETVRALLEQDRSLRIGAASVRVAKLAGCKEIVALVEQK
jgi:ankyrin repeat protein